MITPTKTAKRIDQVRLVSLQPSLFHPSDGGLEAQKISLSNQRHGCHVVFNKKKNVGTTVYLTTGPIYGMQQLANGKILIYERDKSIPWSFTEEGNLVEEADFNKYLRTEQRQYCEYHGITLEELEQELSETLETKNYRYRN